jgi:hypothetical protein
MNFIHFAIFPRQFPLLLKLLKEGWPGNLSSDFYKVHSPAGVVDSFRNTNLSVKCLPFFIRFLVNQPVLNPNQNQPPQPGAKALLYVIISNRLVTPPSKGGETLHLETST